MKSEDLCCGIELVCCSFPHDLGEVFRKASVVLWVLIHISFENLTKALGRVSRQRFVSLGVILGIARCSVVALPDAIKSHFQLWQPKMFEEAGCSGLTPLIPALGKQAEAGQSL